MLWQICNRQGMGIVFFNQPEFYQYLRISENNVPPQVIMNHQKEGEEESGDPYFDPATATNLTSLVGAVARLGCSVHNLGHKTVSGRLEYY